MGLSFRGEFNQKVDGKGRMSIPADFRAVLADGDPRCPENPNPRLVVLHGSHLKGHLAVYTIEEMEQIEEGIRRMKRGSPERKRASRKILGKSWETEIDKDGRIVLPQRLREQISLGGLATMTAMGDHFELWDADTYERFEAEDEDDDDDVDPLIFLDEPPTQGQD